MLAGNEGTEYQAAELKSSNTKAYQIIILGVNVLFLTLFEIFKKFIKIFAPSKPESLENQLALVTGGGNGLGKALSMRLAQEKCDIAIVDVDIKNATKTANEIQQKFGVQCRAYQCDISDNNAIIELKNKIESEMRSVDILVNNAGIIYSHNFTTSNVKDIQKVVEVNLTAQLLMVRNFFPTMIDRNYGKIVTTSSISALNALPGAITYTATKYGVNGFMNALYDELCVLELDDKIKLTTIYPDFIATRKEVENICDSIGLAYNMLTPERVADEAIEAVKAGKREKVVSDLEFAHVLIHKLPDRARKYAKLSMGSIKNILNH